MAKIWLEALPFFLSAAFEFSVKHADGSTEEVTITHSLWFLLILPFAMIAENIARKKRANSEGSASPQREAGPRLNKPVSGE